MTGEWPASAGTGTAALSGSSRAVGLRRPPGPGVRASGPRRSALWAWEERTRGGRGAVDPSLLLGRWAGARCPAAAPDPPPARGGPEHLLGRVAAFLQGRPSPGATDLRHLGSAPASCPAMAAHAAAFTDVLVNVSGVVPVPPEPGGRRGRCHGAAASRSACPEPALGVGTGACDPQSLPCTS